MNTPRIITLALIAGAFSVGCNSQPVLTADMPLHLEEHLDAATITGSDLPPIRKTVEWSFDQPQPDWMATPEWNLPHASPTLVRTGDGVRVGLPERNRNAAGALRGGIHVNLSDWARQDWAEVTIRARADSSSGVNNMRLGFNLRDGRGGASDQVQLPPFMYPNGAQSPIVRDGNVQTYRLRVAQGAGRFRGGAWKQLGIMFETDGDSGSIEILKVSVTPSGGGFGDSAQGVQPVTVGERILRTLFTHAPSSHSFRVRIPEKGRLDLALGVGGRAPVTFAVTASFGRGKTESLLEERHTNAEEWAQRSVDLAKYAGQTVTLSLTAASEEAGAVALWGAPTWSGRRNSTKPNVIFYIIDGGGADMMSLYGYNRRTTPNLERLAIEGAVFEHAYSTSLWTGPSTATFMTALHNSVLGIQAYGPTPPVEARTMAERFHDAGYPTAVFTSNPNAGHNRGVDVFRDAGVEPPFGSSAVLHRDFWNWRATSPGEPYWVHFQTTDVHRPHIPQAPFAGLFAPTSGRAQMVRWDSIIRQWQLRNPARGDTQPLWRGERFKETGIDRKEYYNLYRALFDESMAHQDYQLGRFVERLKESGEWENTLLVIAADHSINRGSVDFLLPLADSMPPEWSTEWGMNGNFQSPIFRSSNSRVPLIFVWKGHIAGGQRLRQPVSMIDVLPTLLELSGLPAAEVSQGQSLAPLLLGKAGWKARPVIFDEFRAYPNNGDRGMIEMLDGRWGASLWIGPPEDSLHPRPTPLILYDVWADPQALTHVNDLYPELVKKYTALLEKQWEAHRLLAKRFTPGGKTELTPEQLQTLRALGYIR